MKNVSPEAIAVIAAVVVAAAFHFSRKRQPKERNFKCGRCSTVSAHTPRTIEAWRAGKAKFFCNACHEQWLRSHSPTAQGNRITANPGRASNSGCLGVMTIFLLLQVLFVIVWWSYA